MVRSSRPVFRHITALVMVTITLAIMAASQSRSVGAAGLASEPPIILQIGQGDLWEWLGQGKPLKQLTSWHYNYNPVLSPDGSQVAYLSYPSFVVQDIARNGGRGGGFPPANVWVLNLKTGNAVRIADQLPNASYGNESLFILRPTPAWSPDGKELAWVEIVGSSAGGATEIYNLIVYNVATQTATTTVKNVPGEQYGEGLDGETVSWSKAGLAYFVDNMDASTQNLTSRTLYLYNESGKQLTTAQLPTLPLVSDTAVVWANVDTHPIAVIGLDNYLAGGVGHMSDYAYDPADNSVKGLAGQLQISSPTAQNGIVLVGGYDSDDKRTWALPNTSVMLQEPIALSPDGNYAAVVSGDGQNQITLYDQQGNPAPIDLKLAAGQQIHWLGWGPIAYKVVQPR